MDAIRSGSPQPQESTLQTSEPSSLQNNDPDFVIQKFQDMVEHGSSDDFDWALQTIRSCYERDVFKEEHIKTISRLVKNALDKCERYEGIKSKNLGWIHADVVYPEKIIKIIGQLNEGDNEKELVKVESYLRSVFLFKFKYNSEYPARRVTITLDGVTRCAQEFLHKCRDINFRIVLCLRNKLCEETISFLKEHGEHVVSLQLLDAENFRSEDFDTILSNCRNIVDLDIRSLIYTPQTQHLFIPFSVTTLNISGNIRIFNMSSLENLKVLRTGGAHLENIHTLKYLEELCINPEKLSEESICSLKEFIAIALTRGKHLKLNIGQWEYP
jgi:hypothetical protein